MDHRENQPDRLSKHWLDSTDCEKLPLLTNLWKKSGVKQGEGLGKVQPHPPRQVLARVEQLEGPPCPSGKQTHLQDSAGEEVLAPEHGCSWQEPEAALEPAVPSLPDTRPWSSSNGSSAHPGAGTEMWHTRPGEKTCHQWPSSFFKPSLPP